MEEKRSFADSIKEFVKFLVIASAIALPVRYFVAQPFIVKGASMQPNFENSEYLIIDELSYFFREPERGEVVVFRYPLDTRQYFIKRIIGLPGERVEIKGGKVFTGNADSKESVLLEEPYLSKGTETTGDYIIITLGSGDYFVLGDNRTQSSDGRVWGALPRRLIIGRALLRAWPVSKAGLLE
ncbi:MAG: signal peptidase I [Candidatus Sungbacteria bacterium]|nr:signal peptidase I [Candidatus Sungbacteria bacterium]